MDGFNTSLYREKFLIKDKECADASGKDIEVNTNRILFVLGSGKNKEEVVVRTKRAYLSMILASRILRDYFYEDKDPLLKRIIPVEWDALWSSTLSDYEKQYNADIWSAVYINGEPYFNFDEPELLNVIEKCAYVVANNYDDIPETLEAMIEKAGKVKTVEYETARASDVKFEGDATICNVTNHHNEKEYELKIFDGEGKEEDNDKLIEESLLLCAAYLEMFDLKAFIAEVQAKLDASEIDDKHDDARKMRNALARTIKVSDYIKEMEKEHNVEYSPERPDID